MPTSEILATGLVPVKGWTRGVPVEEAARQQLRNIANLPFVFRHVAVMPDVHFGIGATVGSVIATKGAMVPAAVGVDIGCGMAAVRLAGVAPSTCRSRCRQFDRRSNARFRSASPRTNRANGTAARPGRCSRHCAMARRKTSEADGAPQGPA